jgi:hypothetical protein
MTRLRSVLVSAALAATAVGASAFAGAATLQDEPPVLDDKSLRTWLDFILPTAEENRWEKLGWRPELGAAIQEARTLQRPILLWAMNGHPCGLT